MAWETVDLLPLITSDFNGSDYVMEDANGYRNPGTGNLNDNITPVQIETSFWDSYEANDYIIGDSNAGIRFNGTGNSGISLMLSGTAIVTISLNSGWGLKPFVLVAGINRETERGSIFMVNRYYDFPEGASSYPDTYRNDVQGGFLNDNSVYQALTGIIASPYNWTAVESISGRLGTLNLTQIKSDSINDGAAVTGASSSSFDNLVEANRLKALITAVLPEPVPTGTDVTVQYNIGSVSASSYTYCKLVVKKGSIPNDVTDGDRIIDLDATKSSVLVSRLKGSSKYYFVIFVKDSNETEASSDPKNITTGPVYEYTLADIAKTLDTSKMQLYVNNAWWDSYQSVFAQYMGSDNILQCVRNGGSRLETYDGVNIKTSGKWGVSETAIWIPIERTSISKVSMKGYTDNYGTYRYGQVWLSKVENNKLVESELLFQLPLASASDKSVEHTLETPFEADYIRFQAGDGSIYMWDILLES